MTNLAEAKLMAHAFGMTLDECYRTIWRFRDDATWYVLLDYWPASGKCKDGEGNAAGVAQHWEDAIKMADWVREGMECRS